MHSRNFYRKMWNTLREKRQWHGRIINRNKAGELFVESATIAPLRNREGEITGYLSVKRDITQQEELEQKIQQTQKMEAVGQLAGGVAHDFNNILQVIVGYAELMNGLTDQDSALRKPLEEIQRATERARQLVRQLLAFSRKETLQLEEVEVNQLIHNMTKVIQRVIGEHIMLTCRAAAPQATVEADPGQIEQLLLNLCLNARDAMPAGGNLTVETENVIVSDAYCRLHPEAIPGDFVVLIVSDTGKGIAPEIRERIFEPFFTTKDVGQGSGLGLSTVYAIAQRHGGFLDFDSTRETGTRFRIPLPIHQKPSHNPAPVSREEPGSRSRQETILVAEDDPQVQYLVDIILKKAGYRVLTASNGEEAIQLFTRHQDEIQLALLDVIMPGITGREVYEHIRKRSPSLPILFASGHTYEVLESGNLPEGDYQLIRKPYQQARLLKEISDALEVETAP